MSRLIDYKLVDNKWTKEWTNACIWICYFNSRPPTQCL